MYPQYLVPQKNFRYINTNNLPISNTFFLRKTNSKIYRNSDGEIIEELIADPKSRNQLLDYSINLLGVFKCEDVKFEIVHEKSQIYHARWKPKLDGKLPANDEILLEENNGHLFFLQEGLNNFQLKFDDNSNKNTKVERNITHTSILHSPTFSNFWHFEINWIYDGERDIKELSKSPQRSALSTIRSYLKEISSEDIPQSFYYIENDLFQ